MSIDIEASELVRLVDRCRTGDDDAWQRLYELHHPLVFGYVKRNLRCSADAADVVQDTFIKAFRNIHQLREARRFPSWLLVTAKRTLINFVTRGEKARTVPSEVLEIFPRNEDSTEAVDYAWIQSELNGLDGPCGETARRRYLSGDPLKVIARDMRCPLGTVKRRLFDARKLLKSSVWAAPKR